MLFGMKLCDHPAGVDSGHHTTLWAGLHLHRERRCRRYICKGFYAHKGFALLEIYCKLQNFGKDENWNKPQNQDIDTKLLRHHKHCIILMVRKSKHCETKRLESKE